MRIARERGGVAGGRGRKEKEDRADGMGGIWEGYGRDMGEMGEDGE